MKSSEAVKSGFLRRMYVPLTLIGLLGIAVFTGSCRSLTKAEIGELLQGLGKNAALRSISRLSFRADLGLGESDYELVYHHSPAQLPGAEVPVVLIHGTPSTLYSWTEIIKGLPGGEGTQATPGLAATRDVYALEVIGHGIAPGDASPYSFERCARFIVAALHALELERVHLVGSSYGAEFCWRAALNAPQLFESLVLLDSSGYPRREADWLPEEVEMRENSLANYGWWLNSKARITTALAPHFRVLPPDRVEEFFWVCENASNWRAMIDLVRDENGLRSPELIQLQVPTLLLWGAEDLAYGADYYAQLFDKDIPNSRLEVLPETGHYPHEERPALVLARLSLFFDDVEAGQ